MYRKLLICGCFRHKKGRPWTPLDVYLVEPGGFEPVEGRTHCAATFRFVTENKGLAMS